MQLSSGGPSPAVFTWSGCSRIGVSQAPRLAAGGVRADRDGTLAGERSESPVIGVLEVDDAPKKFQSGIWLTGEVRGVPRGGRSDGWAWCGVEAGRGR